jgi:glycerol-3-phosphate acyltransferase PlsY
MTATLILVGAYLVGSIPFSYLVAKRWGVSDVRRVGSGNVGAANVMRSAGRTAGLIAFFLDAVKGALALRLPSSNIRPPVAAAFAVLGHMDPVWLSFKGGKGVATGVGAFFPLAPLPSGLGLLVFALVLLLTRLVSLASVTATACLVLFAFLLGSPRPVAEVAACVGGLVILKHRSNLMRIARGVEGRLGSGAA